MYVVEKKEKNDSYMWLIFFKCICEFDVCILEK